MDTKRNLFSRESSCLTIMIVAAVLALTAPAAWAQRTKELGVINYYAKYEANTPSRTKGYSQAQEKIFAALKKLAPAAEWVDVDVFLKDGQAGRDAYKRLLLLPMSDTFTKEMHQGMADYIQRGGLLITCVSCVIVDKDANYKHDDSDPATKDAANSFLGVWGTGGVNITEIKALQASPLTKGLTVGEWLKLPAPLTGRATKNMSATVAVTSKQFVKERETEGPFLTYKSAGKGACIYLVSGLDLQSETSLIGKLTKNVLSPEALAALCLP